MYSALLALFSLDSFDLVKNISTSVLRFNVVESSLSVLYSQSEYMSLWRESARLIPPLNWVVKQALQNAFLENSDFKNLASKMY